MNLWKYNSVKLAFIVIALHSIIQVIMSYLFSFLIVDTVEELIKVVLSIFMVQIINAFLLVANRRTAAVASYYLKMDLNQKIDKSFSKKRYSEFMKKDSGEHASLYVNDVTEIIRLIFEKKLSIISQLVIGITSFIALLKIHYSMALVAISSVAILYITPKLFEKKLSKCIAENQEAKEKFLNRVRELLQGYSTFLENSAFNCFFRKSNKVSYEYASTLCKADTFAGVMSGVLTLVNSTQIIVSLAILSYLVLKGILSAGALLSIITLMPAFSESILIFMSEKTFYKSGIEFYKEKFKYIDDNNESNIKYTRAFLKKKYEDLSEEYNTDYEEVDSLEINNLSIQYGENIISFPSNILFEKGKKYALVGESGCGKSTLLKAIIGEIDNYSGEILVNGNKKDSRKNLFNNISYFNQNTYLFNDSIKNNILLDRSMSDEELKELLKIVHLDEFDPSYIISENGNNLSGGQRQRIALARVLSRNKKILILDEATANLDLKTTEFIEEFVLNSEYMVIMISHHLSEKSKNKLDKIYDLSN